MLLGVMPVAGWGGDPVARKLDAINKRLKEVERSIDAGQIKSKRHKNAARQLKDALERSRQERIAAASSIRELEDRIITLEDEIDELGGAARKKDELLEQRRAQFAKVLVALQRLSQLPPEAVIARTAPPTELVRSAILLRSTVPRIEAQAARLREDLAALAETRRILALRRGNLKKARTSLTKQGERLEEILARTRQQHRNAIKVQRVETMQLEALAKEAADLRELFHGLLNPRGAAAPKIGSISTPKPRPKRVVRAPKLRALIQPKTTNSRSNLPLPVVGRMIRRYGQSAANGITQKGITIATRAGARVVALHDGTVVFAGPFRGYGQLLIISHGEGYHSLLAGLYRIDGILGQILKAGEPVGVMGQGTMGRPSLYLELRRGGQPVNPISWLKSSKGKASG